MVGPFVDHHVGLLGHVALHTERTFAAASVDLQTVEVVVARVVTFALVALQAEAVALEVQLQRVAVVAVAAAHLARVHLALQERPVDVDLVEDLTVRVVQPLAQQRRQVGVEQLTAGVVVVAQLGAAAMAGRAQLHLLARIHAFCFDHQFIISALRPGHIREFGPFHMEGTGSMASLTADVDF